ncbi:hypothetical protein PHAMO_210204 [Magnetospirillum molischianum DSM 120]|uniref:Uncharacterized protein n=1 Tax=Magnetospirillum molischianum DSM 120 TaxID=1150626 RepID=H8FQQ5_MAGML|nr:hypothetical protein PHAMO_210204 [Magnetospirillum molischianum DSM 120]
MVTPVTLIVKVRHEAPVEELIRRIIGAGAATMVPRIPTMCRWCSSAKAATASPRSSMPWPVGD